MSRAFAFIDAARRRWPWTDFVTVGLVAALMAVLVSRWLGVSEALDARLQEVFYQVRGERSSDKNVLLVEIDDHSIAQWGPLPWTFGQYAELVESIAQGEPRAIGFLEPSSVLWCVEPEPPDGSDQAPGDALPDPAAKKAESRCIEFPPVDLSDPRFDGVFLPPLRAKRPDLAGYLGDQTTLASVPLTTSDGGNTVFANLLAHLGHDDLGDELPVNFLGPDSEVPLLSAYSVIVGNLSRDAYTDRVVIIGRAHTETALAMPTPVGRNMTMAQVQAHALLALEDDAAWWYPSGLWRWLLLLFYSLAMILALYKRPMRTMLYTAIGFILGLVVVRYIGFTTGTFLVSFSDPLNVTLATFVVAVLFIESEARFQLARLGHQLESNVRPQDWSLEQLWKEAIRVAQRYTDAHSSMIAEIAPDGQDIRIQAMDGMTLEDIAETNRDIGKPPFRGPLLAKRFEILSDFMHQELGLQTIMVPLVVGSEGVGFWILNYKTTELPTPAQERCIEQYATQFAHTLADIRSRLDRQPRAGQSKTRSRAQLMTTIENVAYDARNLAREQRIGNELAEHLPVGLAVATLWQDIVMVNAYLSKLMSDLNIWLSDTHDVVMLMVKLTDTPAAEIQASLRTVAQERKPRVFAIPQTDYILTLAWVYVRGRDNDMPLARFVLTATRGTAPTRVSGEGEAFDVSMVIMEVLAILRSDTSLPQRQIRIELEYPTPRARGSSSLALAALLVMLRDTAAHGNLDMPCMLSVEADNHQIIVSVSDATYSIPSSAVEAMLREVGGAEDTKSSLASIKNRLEESNTGHLEVESLYGSGIMFRLQLPVET